MQQIVAMCDKIFGEGRHKITWFCDDGLSGALGSEVTATQRKIRPQFKAMREAIRKGEFDCLAILTVSRLGRDHRHVLDVIEEDLIPTDTDFLSVVEAGVDIYTHEGILQLHVLSAVAAYARKDNARRCQLATATAFADGYQVGRPSYGWRFGPKEKSSSSKSASAAVTADAEHQVLGDGEPEQVLESTSSIASSAVPTAGVPAKKPRPPLLRQEKQGKVVVLIKDWFLSGWSLAKIAAELTRQGIPSPKKHKAWPVSGVRHVLLDPVHAGYVKLREKGRGKSKDTIKLNPDGKHSERRYYDPEVYQQILDTMGHRKHFQRTNTGCSGAGMLSGLVFCGDCGHRLYNYNPNSDNPCLACTQEVDEQRTCPGLTVRKASLEQAVVEAVAEISRMPEQQTALREDVFEAADREEQQLQNKAACLQKSLAAVDGHWQRLFDKLGSVDELGEELITDEEFAVQKKLLKQEKDSLQQQLGEVCHDLDNRQEREALAAAVEKNLYDFPAAWGHLDVDEQRALLAALLERITVHRNTDARSSPNHLFNVKIKVRLLAEYERPVFYALTASMKVKPTGLESLSKRHLAYLYRVSQGKSKAEISEIFGVRYDTIPSFIMEIRRCLGVTDINEAAAIARPRILAEMATLPLGKIEHFKRGEGPLLSPKLMDVLRLMANGANCRRIARMLDIPLSTVIGRRAEIFKILEVNDAYDAVVKARALGILD
jgi:DNA-binding CsgD family transcriptional regulator